MFPPSPLEASKGPPRILLFDVDGTLVDTGGAGRTAIEAAFSQEVGSAEALAFSMAGMTDRGIIREGLRRAGVADSAARSRIEEAYLAFLPDEVMQASNYVVCEGVVPLLQAAAAADCAVGLGTGNLERGAQIKLRRGGLAHFFHFGGFGSDHELRPAILRIGAERGARLLGVPRVDCRVVVIGDTPRDVSAALAIDAQLCVGVGTGGSSPEELLACGATHAFATLRDEGALETVLEA